MIQFRRAGLRLRRLFSFGQTRDDAQTAVREAAMSTRQSRAVRDRKTELAAIRSKSGSVPQQEEHARKWSGLLPASHRAWLFAAVTGTLGILLLLCWQLYGSGYLTGDAAGSPNAEVVTLLNPPESSSGESTSAVQLFGEQPRDTKLDGTDDFRAQTPSDAAETPSTPSPSNEFVDINSKDRAISDWQDPPALKAPTDEADTKPVDVPMAESETVPSFPDLNAEPRREAPRDEFAFNDSKPKSEAAEIKPSPEAKETVRNLLEGREPPHEDTRSPKLEETPRSTIDNDWSAHEDKPLADERPLEPPTNDRPLEPRTDDQPKPEVGNDPFGPAPTLNAPPEKETTEPEKPTLTEPVLKEPAPITEPTKEPVENPEPAPTRPTDERPLPARDESERRESERDFPKPPSDEPAPVETRPELPSHSSSGSALTNVVPPQLRLEILSPARVALGKTCSVGFRVTNLGTVPAEEVRILLDLPEGLDYHKGRALAYTVGTLAPGETREARLSPHAVGIGQGYCRGVLQTSGERIADAQAPVTVSQQLPPGNLRPVEHLQPMFPNPEIYHLLYTPSHRPFYSGR